MNRTASTFVVLAGLAGAYFATLGRAHFAEIAALRTEAMAAYGRSDAVEAETRREPELLACLADLERWATELRPTLTQAGESTALLMAATDLLKKYGLVVERSDAMPLDNLMTRPHRRIRIAVSGRLADLFRALNSLENAPLPTRVTELSMQAGADGSSVRGELTIVSTWSEGS